MRKLDEKTCAELAKTLTAMCVRNGEIEGIHAGISPTTKTGDYSDVKVIDANGEEFAWSDASHISQDEMKMLMKGIVNRVYTALMQWDDPRLINLLEITNKIYTTEWDEPKFDSEIDCNNFDDNKIMLTKKYIGLE